MPHLASLSAGDGTPILLAATGGPSVVQGQLEAFWGLLGPVGFDHGPGRDGLAGGVWPGGSLGAVPVEGVASGTGTALPGTAGAGLVERGREGSALDLEVVAGDGGPARTRGFGALLGHVGPADSIGITFFDAQGRPLGAFFAPGADAPDVQVFLGVYFGESLVARVRITGLVAEGEDGPALAGLIFGEPVALRATGWEGPPAGPGDAALPLVPPPVG